MTYQIAGEVARIAATLAQAHFGEYVPGYQHAWPAQPGREWYGAELLGNHLKPVDDEQKDAHVHTRRVYYINRKAYRMQLAKRRFLERRRWIWRTGYAASANLMLFVVAYSLGMMNGAIISPIALLLAANVAAGSVMYQLDTKART